MLRDFTRIYQIRCVWRRIIWQNSILRMYASKEHMLQQNYYKELLDVQSCGLMAYTLPGYRILHMNAEALRMYGYEDIQSRIICIMIRGFLFPNSETVEKLKALSQ